MMAATGNNSAAAIATPMHVSTVVPAIDAAPAQDLTTTLEQIP